MFNGLLQFFCVCLRLNIVEETSMERVFAVSCLLVARILGQEYLEAMPSAVTCPWGEVNQEDTMWLHHQFECSVFFQCNNGEQTPSLLLRCPSGSIFSQGIPSGCQRPEYASCSPEILVQPVETTSAAYFLQPTCPETHDYVYHLPDPSGNCSRFLRCDGGDARLFECPRGSYFEPVLEICDYRQPPDGCRSCQQVPEPQCPPTNDQLIHLPHPTLCDAFYKCNWGNPVLLYCPDGLHFNPLNQVCDWPRNVECNRCLIS